MQETSFESKMARYIDAGFPILYVNSYEEEDVDKVIGEVCNGREIVEWNEILGFIDFITKSQSVLGDTASLEQFLDYIKDDLQGKIIVLKDVVPYFNEPRIISKIKWLARQITMGVDATIIIVSGKLEINPELEKYITILDLDYLSVDQIKSIIRSFLKENEESITEELLDESALAFKGLSEFEINNILALSLATLGTINRKSLRLIFDQKQQLIKKAGILEMVPPKESLDDIGGLEVLKDWLERKSKVFKNFEQARSFGVDMPKGVLITGMPGCGKSLSAKAAASLFEVPLLRLDMGRLMGKYVGESEANMRKAISLAEAISPCVLWVDELEKAFAGINSQGSGAEVTTRLFGNFLTWMQEKESPVFVVATANNIRNLPPELLRKGRFDEVFYVALPKLEEKRKIFEIHISKRRKADVANIDINKLVEKTVGYSGADIESVVKEAVENAFADGKDSVTTNDLLAVIAHTHPLTEVMSNAIDELEKDYADRKIKNASK